MTETSLPALCPIDDFLKHEYDFIIIGGGTAGLCVAARLTEIPHIHVGVIEAGAANIGDPMILTPALYLKMIGDAKYDWNHMTVPQKDANNFARAWPRGKGLGGSSSINYQMYVRGHAADYDDWARLGNKGWEFASLLPYFKKHEHFDDPSHYSSPSNIPLETTYDPNFHGKNGPIHTSFSTWRLPAEKEWIAASSKLGKKMGSPMDAWGGNHLGTYHSLSTIDRSKGPMNGTRSYATTGYFLPNASRPNLHVLVESLVSKIIITEKGTAKGVEFIHANKVHTVSVKKEVILSAGAVKSPQILELSGIGNPLILEKVGIRCIVPNHRVGENLRDHPATGLAYELVEGEKSLDMLQDPDAIQAAMGEYMTSRSGPLSSGGAAMGFASFANLASREEVKALTTRIATMPQSRSCLDEKAIKLLNCALKDPKDGTIQIVLLPASLNMDRTDDQTVMLAPPESMHGKQGIFIAACLGRPFSAGSCHIRSPSSHDDPAIDPAYYSHPADIDLLQKGLQLIDKVVQTSPFKEKIKKRHHPAAESLNLDDRDQVAEYVRQYTTGQYHPIGSVSMGVKGTGAVDSRLRVWGCKGLRVVDASVMPLHVSGNIVATVYAIGEKASDMIKEDWGLASRDSVTLSCSTSFLRARYRAML